MMPDLAEMILEALAAELPVHRSAVVFFDPSHTETPAEVCTGCSDPKAGRWVPVSFCPEARKHLGPL